MERALAEVAKEAAVPRDAAEAKPPRPITDRRALNQGREAYTGACASCHGATGDGRGLFGQAMYPDATDLRSHETQEKSDGELFWIIKNGYSFGGMPSFAGRFSDEALWTLVGYTRALAAPGGPSAAPLAIPTPTADDLAFADPHAADPLQRGAAVYAAQACGDCHGPRGNAPGDLAIDPSRKGLASLQTFRDTLAKPDAGMPRYSSQEISDKEQEDLYAFLQTFAPARRAQRPAGSS